MKNKIVLLTGVAVGYVLGTRAGREQYEKIRSQAEALWKDPRVQEQVSNAQQKVKEQVPVLQDKAQSAASHATGGSEEFGGGSGGMSGGGMSGGGMSGTASGTGAGFGAGAVAGSGSVLDEPDPLERDRNLNDSGSGI